MRYGRRLSGRCFHFVRGYKEEGTITMPFYMTVLNDLDRFQLKDKLIEHKRYIDEYGEDMPEIRNWKWSNPK